MYLFFRLMKVGLFSRYKKKVGLLDTIELSFITWPTDLDIFLHMNNGRYFSILDLCRFDCLVRNGVAQKLKENKWFPVVAAESIEFKKSLKLFDRFIVKTNLLGWDEKYFYIQHIFMSHEKIYAKAIIKGRILKREGGTISTREMLDLVGFKHVTPKVPEWILHWGEHQRADARMEEVE